MIGGSWYTEFLGVPTNPHSMHDLVFFLYCSATIVEGPTTTAWWQNVCVMIQCILPGCDLPQWDKDPLLIISLLHRTLDPDGFNIRKVILRFLSHESDVGSTVWGPVGWRLLHNLARNTAQFQRVPDLLSTWTTLLPCERCRHHLARHLATLPFKDVTTPDAMYALTVDLHNSVNAGPE